MASASIGGGGFIFFSNYDVNNTIGEGYDWFVYPAQNTVFNSTGNMYTIWRSRQGSLNRLMLAELDGAGQVVNSRSYTGYLRGQTYHKLGDATNQGSFITVDDNDNPYIGWGTNSGGYTAKLAKDLSSITWDQVIFGYGQYCSGGFIDPHPTTYGNLVVKSPDQNNVVSSINGSTGAHVSQFRDVFTNPGAQIDTNTAIGVYAGNGYLVYPIRSIASTKDPLLAFKYYQSSSSPFDTKINNYAPSNNNSWEYPTGVGTQWKIGDPWNAWYKIVVTGRGKRSGSDVFYITETSALGSQTNNLYYSTSNSAGITYASSGVIDSSGNTYVFFSNNGQRAFDVVKLDSSYNVDQAIRIKPTSGSYGNNQYASGIQYCNPRLSRDENFLCMSNGVYDVGVSYQNRAYMAMKIPTDLTSAVGGPHNIPLGGGWTGDQFEITDVTSAISSVLIKETTTLTGATGTGNTTLGNSNYAANVSGAALNGSQGTVTIP